MICLLGSVAESAERLRVGVIHYKPMTHLSIEQRASGIMVDRVEADLPQPEDRPRQAPVLYFNPKTEAFWYEYVPRPPTQEELLADVIALLSTMSAKLDEVVSRLAARG